MKLNSTDNPHARRCFLKKVFHAAIGVWIWHWTGSAPNAANAPEKGVQKVSLRKLPEGTGFIFHNDYLQHKLSQGHPESPKRLAAIRDRMKASGLREAVKQIKPLGNPLPAIRRIHAQPHINLAVKAARDPSICFLAVSGALAAVDLVCTGQLRNAFCAIRPPGHHATNTGLYGFCFFNNIAIAARYAQIKFKLKKILIVDWDYHHGNGTEWAFYDDPSVLFFSTHRLKAFPFTGFPERRGQGRGYGYNINIPLAKGAGDKDILSAFEADMLPAAERFKPELVLISAGFDSRKNDPLGDFEVTDDGFARITAMTKSIAEQYAHARIVSLLEGGYHPEGLASAVVSHIAVLLD